MGSNSASKVLGLLPKLKGEVNCIDWSCDVQLVLLGYGLDQYLLKSKMEDANYGAADETKDRGDTPPVNISKTPSSPIQTPHRTSGRH